MTPPTGTAIEQGVPAGRRMVRAAVWLPGLAVALGAAVATAHGLFEVAQAAGVPTAIAWLYPLITDGLALVAYTATARLTGSAARYAWSVVVLAAGLSGLAQAAYLAGGATLHASPALRFGVGAWPAVAAAVVAHLLYLLAAEPTAQTAVPGAAASDPRTPSPASAGTDGDERGALSAATSTGDGPVQPGVQPGVQPRPYTPPAVQHDPYNPASTAAADRPESPAERVPEVVEDGPVEHPADPVEPSLNDTSEPAPRDRARTAAVRHAARHGALPTVSELEALAAVSRGTAAAALKALRQHPAPMHLVHDNPDPRTQP